MERLGTQIHLFYSMELGGGDMVLVCKYLCSGEISSVGVLCTAEKKVQHKGKDGKQKS